MQLPDCFWTLTKLTRATLQNVIIAGSSKSGQAADPLARLPSTLRVLRLFNSRLINPKVSGSNFKIDWSTFFASKSSLRELTLDNLQFEGTLPARLPAGLEAFYVPRNLLTGSLPENLFTDIDSNFMEFSAANNKLSGSILPRVITNFHGVSLHFEVNNNSLSGTFPKFTRMFYSASFNLANNRLTGTIPGDYFNNDLWGAESFRFNANNNLLTGAIPGNLFSLVNVKLTTLELELAGNALTGSIPNLFAAINPSLMVDSLVVDLSRNQLTGSINNNIWPPTSLGVSTLSAKYALNRISGALPSASLFSLATGITSIDLDLSGNELAGTIEPNFLTHVGHMDTTSVTLSLANNSLTGPLTPELVSAVQQIGGFSLDMSSNPIGGELPYDLLSSYGPPSSFAITDLTLNFANCGLTGAIPSVAFGPGFLSLNVDANALTAIPTLSWSAYLSDGIRDDRALVISAADNKFTGALSLPATGSSLRLNVRGNNFTSLTFDSNSQHLMSLDVGMNPNMTGTLPSSLFDSSSYITSLIADHTSLTGSFPDASNQATPNLRKLDLSNTEINFCGSSSISSWNPYQLIFCSLVNTDVGACIANYPPECQADYKRSLVTPSTPSTIPATTNPALGVPTSDEGPAPAPNAASSIGTRWISIASIAFMTLSLL